MNFDFLSGNPTLCMFFCQLWYPKNHSQMQPVMYYDKHPFSFCTDHATVILKLYEEHLRRALLACEKNNILLTELQVEGFTIAMTSENDTSATHILQCIICQTVRNEPSFLKKLVTILRRCRHEINDLKELGLKLEREWTKSQSIHSIIAKRSAPTIPLSPTLKNDFAAVVIEFENLKKRFWPYFKSSKPSTFLKTV